MERNDPTQIEFKGARKMVRFYCEGVMSSGRSFFIKDQSSDEWKICSADRLATLSRKYGSVEAVGLEYTSRKTKRSPSGAKGDKVLKQKVSTDIDSTKTDRDKGLWIDPELRGPEYTGW